MPDGYFYSIGTGDRNRNLYPLVHTQGVAEGSRRDRPNKRNLILARAAYIGSQRYGNLFWSSDIHPTWQALKQQVTTGLNFTASGLAYWGNDIGGWQWHTPPHGPERKPLVDPSDARNVVGNYDDYPELARALFMDFPNDPKVVGIGDQYMFGPAFLVAPVTEQGRESREVYLPAGSDWHNYWTNEKLAGGQTVTVAAPIDVIPLFVRAGSIVPMGADVSSTATPQSLKEIRVYPGKSAGFTLYDDDGVSYDYEKGIGRTTRLQWDDKLGQLSAEGDKAVSRSVRELTKIVR